MASHDGLTGNIAHEEWRWRKRHNYYLNCLRDADRNLTTVLDELDALGLTSKTIVVYTADHGDLDGAHGLHAKGATAYREQNQVPLIISHPGLPGGKRVKAVTSHLDLVPTLIALTNASPEKKAEITRGLPGKDLSAALRAPERAGTTAVRDGALFCFNMFAYIDGEFMTKARALLAQPGGKGGLMERVKAAGLKPDMGKRGAIRAIYDGRYSFARYFSPKEHNAPNSMEALFRLNDVELYDLQADPNEVNNLAVDRKKNGAVLEAMNAKLNALIAREVGEDIGQMLPGGVDGHWVATEATKDV
jgi:arylsulfatase